MPKRWKIIRGGSFTWQYVETGGGSPKVLAQSNESWETKKEVRKEIEDMRKNNDIEDDEG